MPQVLPGVGRAQLQRRRGEPQIVKTQPASAPQNSILPWKAIMRGELSPPNPTPSSPVGGEIVLVNAPKPVWVPGLPGVPA